MCFNRSALNAGRSSQAKAVCLSVERVHCDKTEERSVHILYHMKTLSLVFSEEWLVGATPFTETEERSVHIFIPYERSLSLVF